MKSTTGFVISAMIGVSSFLVNAIPIPNLQLTTNNMNINGNSGTYPNYNSAGGINSLTGSTVATNAAMTTGYNNPLDNSMMYSAGAVNGVQDYNTQGYNTQGYNTQNIGMNSIGNNLNYIDLSSSLLNSNGLATNANMGGNLPFGATSDTSAFGIGGTGTSTIGGTNAFGIGSAGTSNTGGTNAFGTGGTASPTTGNTNAFGTVGTGSSTTENKGTDYRSLLNHITAGSSNSNANSNHAGTTAGTSNLHSGF